MFLRFSRNNPSQVPQIWNVKLNLYKLNLSSLDSPFSATKKLRATRKISTFLKRPKDFLQRKARLGQFQLFPHQGHQHFSARVGLGLSEKWPKTRWRMRWGWLPCACRPCRLLKGNKGDLGLGSCFSFYQQNPKLLNSYPLDSSPSEHVNITKTLSRPPFNVVYTWMNLII